jgi:formylglycine-generating enzyme required for sulfatase activity
VTGLIANYTSTGQSVAVGNSTQTSGTTANDFSSAVTYTVTAADSSTQDYTVTVSEAAGIAGDSISYTAGSVSFTMVYVPGGLTFPTGTDDLGTPATVTNSYLIGQTEVTYKLWYAVRNWATSNGYTFANLGKEGHNGSAGTAPTAANQEPVTLVNWRDAMVWMNALTEYYNIQNGTSLTCSYHSDASYINPIRDSSDGAYGASINPAVGGFDNPHVRSDATGFRLLSINEWILSARYKNDDNNDGDIQDANEYYPGNYASGATADNTDVTATNLVAVYSGNPGTATMIVKSKSANALGLYDMSGNVWEWSFDLNGSHRLFRSGGWFSASSQLQVGFANSNFPYYEDNNLGFRFARAQ